jgi:hypothetical protein
VKGGVERVVELALDTIAFIMVLSIALMVCAFSASVVVGCIFFFLSLFGWAP